MRRAIVQHCAPVPTIGRAERAHALLRGQSAAAIDHNILHFDEGNGDLILEEQSLGAHHAGVLRAGRSVCRVAAIYVDASNRVVESLTTFSTGFRVGRRTILTALHALAPKVDTGPLVGRLSGIFYRPLVVAPCARLAHLKFWHAARLDHDIQADIVAAAANSAVAVAVAVADRDGTLWAADADLAALHASQDDSFIDGLGRDAFAAPHAAALAPGEEHFVVGYPGRPKEEALPLLWHGREPISFTDLSDCFMGFQRRVASRGQQQVLPAPTPLQPYAVAPSFSVYHLHGHCANALSGMSGGPVVNSAGKIVGIHVGGRSDTGEYNLYLGVDHPSFQAALARVYDARHAE